MKLEFTKMHGTGNDYIYFNCMERELSDLPSLSRAMSPRHISVGADGIVTISKSTVADAKMRIFNADGSEGRMCGNATRCVGKYLYDNGIVDKKEIDLETLSGIKHLSLTVKNGKVDSVKVDMGYASTEPSSLPLLTNEPMINSPLFVAGDYYNLTCISMGNPHAVTFVENVDSLKLEKIGPSFENHPLFPERVNTEFVKVINKNTIKMRVWERGSGETWACGTGACASAVAAILCGYCKFNEDIKVILTGGELTIKVMPDMKVYMSGPCVKVYDGIYEY